MSFNQPAYIAMWVQVSLFGQSLWVSVDPFDATLLGQPAPNPNGITTGTTNSVSLGSLMGLLSNPNIQGLIHLPIDVILRIAARTTSAIPLNDSTNILAEMDNNTEVVDFKLTIQDTPLATNEVDFKGFQFAPNPVKNQMNLKASSKIQKVEFYNMNGQKVLEVKPDNSASQVGTTSLAKGVYLMKVTINGSEKTYKVVKE